MRINIYNKYILFSCKQVLLPILVLISHCVFSQQSRIDSLRNIISKTKEDTVKILLYEDLGQAYRDEKKMDSSVASYKQALEINKKGNYWPQKQCWDIASIDYILYEMGNYTESLYYAEQHLSLGEQLNDTGQRGMAHLNFGNDYRELGDYRASLNHYFKGKEFFKLYWVSRNKPEDNTYTMLCIAQTYLRMKNYDSALIFTNMAYKIGLAESNGSYILLSTRILGDINLAKGNEESALQYYRQYIPDYVKYKERNRDLGFVLNNMAQIFQKRNQLDSMAYYAKKAFANAQLFRDEENLYTAANLLYEYYNTTNEHEAFTYLKIAVAAKDSMRSTEKIRQAQILSFNEQVREKEQAMADAKEAARDRMIAIGIAILIAIISTLIWYRIRQLRLKYKTILEQKEAEELTAKYEKMLLELEAKALRAQMNPHFIFNCMNSIKSLIQIKEEDKAVIYLTTFSKLLRTILQNADQREISLYDEIETCKLYTQLESMRFGNKFNYHFTVDAAIDLKSITVPALIIQPFIENAIWHGIMPKADGGTVTVSVEKAETYIRCMIDDDGIGREISAQNKFKGEGATHQSKGVHLTQSRIDLDNALNQRNGSLEIIDKKDALGNPCGTRIILFFMEM
ncbi:hypothetical protein GD597_07880 [Panacibacter sp. KCS-6]|uniref:Signal transduction histidine kinase internal region domain-containing protein n=1 Tax=Limnovirga soli TaxID=2656915 RepID=A0A8J8FEZ2_9BACT|nr:hypothetical protein [Limnovirga soli]